MKSSNNLIRTLKDYPLAVLCAIIILICGVLIFLRGGAVVELTAQETDLNSRIRTIEQNLRNAKDLKAQVEEVEQLVAQIESRLFDRDQRAVNINFFYSLEDRLDIRISTIDQMPAEYAIYAKGGARELKLQSTIGYNLSVNGQFHEILIFLHELDQVDPLIRIAAFQVLQANNRGEGQGILEARLQLIVLAQKD